MATDLDKMGVSQIGPFSSQSLGKKNGHASSLKFHDLDDFLGDSMMKVITLLDPPEKKNPWTLL